MRAFLAALCCLSAPALAEDWHRLDGPAITAALSSRVLGYEDGTTQNFFQDGRTLYAAQGAESWGKWWVADGKYCSTWPPSDVPACFVVDASGLDIRFTGASGRVFTGRYIDL